MPSCAALNVSNAGMQGSLRYEFGGIGYERGAQQRRCCIGTRWCHHIHIRRNRIASGRNGRHHPLYEHHLRSMCILLPSPAICGAPLIFHFIFWHCGFFCVNLRRTSRSLVQRPSRLGNHTRPGCMAFILQNDNSKSHKTWN